MSKKKKSVESSSFFKNPEKSSHDSTKQNGDTPSNRKKKNKKAKNGKKVLISRKPCVIFILGILGIIFALISHPTSRTHLSSIDKTKILDFMNITESLKDLTSFLERPGKILSRNEHLHKHHPIVMIPGIVTSGLEVWQGKECVGNDFRERYWGTFAMLRKIVISRSCWLDHIMLNDSTWRDPDDIKLRAATGISAADYFVGGYWVWGRIIENLADIGYDENSLYMASYDWRLPYVFNEERDGYFTRLKTNIELLKKIHNQKVVVICHSMGSNVFLFFMKWVESSLGGGGKNWVNEHIESFVNIAGPLAGLPKSFTSVISGETRDTAELNYFLKYAQENILSTGDIVKFFRSLGSLPTMFPQGGDKIWGDANSSPDNSSGHALVFPKDPKEREKLEENPPMESERDRIDWDQWKILIQTWISQQGIANFLKESQKDNDTKPVSRPLDFGASQNMSSQNLFLSRTVEETFQFLEEIAPNYMKLVRQFYSFKPATKESDFASEDPKTWSNTFQIQLPNAPDMKILCLYGVGKDTERAYYYKENENVESKNITPIVISTELNDQDYNLAHGVILSDGDGTVPLISLGYMCVDGWKNKLFNPANIKVVTREYQHLVQGILEEARAGNVFRGGTSSADHVDIMGNFLLLEDIIRIVSNQSANGLENQIFSEIEEISKKINWK